jgi:hypothetical protein
MTGTRPKSPEEAEADMEDKSLDEALDQSFPASDPPAMTQPKDNSDTEEERQRDRTEAKLK